MTRLTSFFFACFFVACQAVPHPKTAAEALDLVAQACEVAPRDVLVACELASLSPEPLPDQVLKVCAFVKADPLKVAEACVRLR